MKKPFTSFKKRKNFKSRMGDTQNNLKPTKDDPMSPEDTFNLEGMAESEIFKLQLHEKNFQRQGFLANMHEVTVLDQEEVPVSALVLSVLDSGGDWFTCYLKHEPYFYLKVKPGAEIEMINFLERKFEGKVLRISQVKKQDLDLMNHLSGIEGIYLKIFFKTTKSQKEVRLELNRIVRKNKFQKTKKSFLSGRGIGDANSFNIELAQSRAENFQYTEESILAQIEDIREHDVKYLVRVAIDRNIRVGKWYNIICSSGFVVKIENEPGLLEVPELGVMAFDIETTKQPLRFPDSQIDEVMLISYVVDGEACLIVNRNIISKDITEFNYAPYKDIDYDIVIYNEPDEKSSIEKFFNDIRSTRPMVLTTFNGDNFDWPFLEDRALIHDIDMTKLLGITRFENPKRALLSKKFMGQVIFAHLDCYHWVKRDAYLPQGSHGLKKVTKAKLGYNPIEVSPEEMVPLARSDPQRLCEYSVSDAVATYHLYKKHIHDFILALCTIVPLNPEMILRHGSGVLCENLLMAQAFSENIIFPSKQSNNGMKFYNNHPIDHETYIGGYVQCINEGVYRADIETDFKLSAEHYARLNTECKEVLDFFIEHESGTEISEVENYDEILNDIKERLWKLQQVAETEGKVNMLPLIYHVDVAAMYPNIILTNRLQPTAIVNEKICCNCVFNKKENECKRKLGWEYKVSYFPLSKKEFQVIRSEKWNTSSEDKMADVIKAVKLFSAKNYKKTRETKIEKREDVICMRENSFYVDTIRDFRDRRYRFKALTKVYARKSREAKAAEDFEKANEEGALATLYDSLQLAHKIILNSFYGYVMKKNARWYSMEMAAMVTYTGAQIIQTSRDLLEKVGKVLELDTDGVWTLFPAGFPEKYTLKTKKGKKLHFGYPCSLMNHLIYDKFKNPQYQDKQGPKDYSKRTEMSIYFELDGPYRGMVIPASLEENKKLKKKYCVFNFDGKISEIKGFELKRRGELEIVKKFQSEIFSRFLDGQDLKGCYESCAKVAQTWLDIILKQGQDMSDENLFELIGDSKVLSKNISEYGEQKGVALTAAKRMAQFLGKTNVFQSAGTRLDFIISRQPEGKPVSERAIPISVFKLPTQSKIKFLREWLGYPEQEQSFEIKNIIDWEYYFTRFSKNVQKIITIPAVLQGLDNPMKDIPNPAWLNKKLRDRNNKEKQTSMTSFFRKKAKTLQDVEQLFGNLNLLDKENKEPLPEKIKEENDTKTIQEEVIEEEIEEQKVSISSSLKGSSKLGRFNMKLLKQKWKKNFKKRRTQEAPVKIDNLKEMTKYIERKVENSTWKIVKISPWKLGEYLFHIIVDKRYMQRVLVKKNRSIFVNFFSEQNSDKWLLSRRKLPRDKLSLHLYQIDFQEDVFVKDFRNLDCFLSDVDVEGVYESQVDLDFLLLRDLGMRCSIFKRARDELRFDEKHRAYQIDAGSLLNELDPDQSTSGLQRVFHDSVFETKGIHFCLIWGLKKGDKTGVFVWGPRKCVLILQGSITWFNKKKTKVEFKNYLQNKIQSTLQESVFGLSRDSPYSLELKLLESEEALPSTLLTIIESFVPSATSSPSILMCQANDTLYKSLNTHDLEQTLKTPIIRLTLPKDSHHRISLNSLTWHKTLANQGITQLPQLTKLVSTLDKLASFSQIPIGNMRTSLSKSLTHAMDVIFSRKLKQMNYLNWYSHRQIPDLGQMGLISAENETLLEECDEDNPNMSANFNSRSVVQPGFYPTFVVEIRISMFIMNALINTAAFEENTYLENANLRSRQTQKFKNPNLHHIGEGLNNLAAFKIIKDLLVEWYQKIKLDRDESADLLISNLMAWMVSEDSKLFDPVIKKRFMKIVTKAFDSLLVRVDELGGKIVLADHHRLLIDTNLAGIEGACDFRQYLINNLGQDPNFRYATFSEGQVLPLLIIHNKADYVGVSSKVSSLDLKAGTDPDYEIDCKLTMSNCLPKEIRAVFTALLEFFINQVHTELVKHQNCGISGKEMKTLFQEQMGIFLNEEFLKNIIDSVDYIKENLKTIELETFHHKKEQEGQTSNETGNISCPSDFNKKTEIHHDFYKGPETGISSPAPDPHPIEQEEEHLNDSFINEDDYENDSFVEDELQQEIQMKMAQDSAKADDEIDIYEGWQKQDMIGQARNLGALELEFVNLLFEILTAGREDPGGNMEKLKKNVILYLEKDCYSEEAQFKSLMLTFMVHEVKCNSCRSVSSLDVFRDISQNDDPHADALNSPYKCLCGVAYDKGYIQKKILLKLQEQIQKCLAQELFCNKCRQIQKTIFQEKCDCSGTFVIKKSKLRNDIRKEMANGLINFRKLANRFNMKRLRRFIERFVF